MAQSVEHVIGNDEVGSSNLPTSSKKRIAKAIRFFSMKRSLWEREDATLMKCPLG